MYCRKCGKQVETNSEYCDECRSEMHGVSVNTRGRKKCCPKCKSRNLQVVMNTDFHSETKGGGFSAGKGCCGLMLLGPLGLLCGACGNKQKTTVTSSSTNVWVCHDCGNKFRDIDDIEADILKAEKDRKIMPATLFAMGVVFSIIEILLICSFIGQRTGGSLLRGLEFLMELLASPAALFSNGGWMIVCLLAYPLIFIVAGLLAKKPFDNKLQAFREEKEYIETNGYINE